MLLKFLLTLVENFIFHFPFKILNEKLNGKITFIVGVTTELKPDQLLFAL